MTKKFQQVAESVRSAILATSGLSEFMISSSIGKRAVVGKTAKKESVEDDILFALKQVGEPVPTTELATELGIDEDTVAAALVSLQSQGKIGNDATGWFVVVESTTSPRTEALRKAVAVLKVKRESEDNEPTAGAVDDTPVDTNTQVNPTDKDGESQPVTNPQTIEGGIEDAGVAAGVNQSVPDAGSTDTTQDSSAGNAATDDTDKATGADTPVPTSDGNTVSNTPGQSESVHLIMVDTGYGSFTPASGPYTEAQAKIISSHLEDSGVLHSIQRVDKDHYSVKEASVCNLFQGQLVRVKTKEGKNVDSGVVQKATPESITLTTGQTYSMYEYKVIIIG